MCTNTDLLSSLEYHFFKYFTSSLRYIEAIDMNEKLRSISGIRRGTSSLPLGHSPLGSRSRNLFGPRDEMTGAPAKAVLTTRDLIINSVAKSLPSVTRELADLCSKEKNFNWKQGLLWSVQIACLLLFYKFEANINFKYTFATKS